MQLSIILPTLNEAATITTTLQRLQPLREAGHEVIVSDGGSDDSTIAQANPLADQLIEAPRGRAKQMNAGANAASGELLLFLHADTLLPEHAVELIGQGESTEKRRWGRFDVRLSGHHPLLRVVEFMMNQRSRLSGIATGDQALFIERSLFKTVGGFPEQPLMEDIALCQRLKPYGRPLCLSARVITSSRRWEQHGILRTIFLMWRLRFAYFCGQSPERLAARYQKG